MKLYRSQSIQRFCSRTQETLLRHQAEHNLLLVIQQMLLQSPNAGQPLPYLARVEENNSILGVAIHMLLRNVVLSKFSDVAVAQLFAEDICNAGIEIPGVAGLTVEVQAFVQAWQRLTQQPMALAMEMRIHRLTQVQTLSRANGQLRVAEGCDRNLIHHWSEAFDQEAFGHVKEWTAQIVDRQLERGSIYLWDNGSPVSMAIGRGSNPGGGRIGPVYTPPEYRQQGYATACVATLSQRLLEQGYSSCFLYTDQSNPTSNHIYQKIGYQYQCDWLEYRFGNAD